MKPAWVVALLLAAAVAFLVARNLASDSGAEAQTLSPGEEEARQDPLPAPLPLEMEGGAIQAAAPARERDSLKNEAWRIVVTSSDGATVEGAEITWMPTSVRVPDNRRSWSPIDWKEAEAATRRATEGEGGIYETVPPSETGDSFLWVTHPEHMARSFSLAEGELPPSRVVLEPAPGIEVLVTAAGEPVSGAAVHQGLFQYEETVEGPSQLKRTYITNEEGKVLASPLPGAQWLIAESGNTRSPIWQGSHPGKATLALLQTFVAKGRLDVPEDDLSTCTIWASVERGGFREVLDSAVPNPDGTWGPTSLQVLEGRRYAFRLISDRFVTQQIEREIPEPGSTVTVDFAPQRGVPVVLRVVDAESTPLADSETAITWTDAAGTRTTVSGNTNEQGETKYPACPLATLTIEADHAGYVLGRVVTKLEEAPTDPIELRLTPAGRIVGRCTFRGEPIEDFKINYWRPSPFLLDRVFLEDREDGRFDLDTAPLGEVRLFAYDNERARSETVTLLVESGSVHEVELELRDPIPMMGTIIDGRTQQPVRDARIQVLNTVDGSTMSTWGASHRVDANGAFEVLGGVPGENWIEVTTDDYPTERYSCLGTDESVDFGTISLLESQSLAFKLEVEQEMDLEACTVSFNGPVYVAPLNLDAKGEAVVEGLQPGTYYVEVKLADTRPLMSTLRLDLGEEWSYELYVPDHDPIVIQVLPAPGEELPPVLDLEISYRTREGVDVYSMFGTRAGEGRFYRPPSEWATIDAYVDGKRAASKRIQPALVHEPIQILLGVQPRTFRVVDAEGTPLSGVSVRLTLPDDVSGWFSDVETDASGLFVTDGLSHDVMLASLRHAGHGSSALVPVFLDGPADEPIEIVLDATAPLGVQLVDGATPLAGVPVAFWDEGGRTLELATVTTDAGALATYRFVSEGHYLARVAHPGLWFTEAVVEASSTPAPVQVRRLGSVVVALTRGGAPVPGARVSLRSVEFDTDVAAWQADGRVDVTPPDGRSTISGEVELEGLPHGRYAWTVSTGDGQLHRGELVVVPERRARVPVELP